MQRPEAKTIHIATPQPQPIEGLKNVKTDEPKPKKEKLPEPNPRFVFLSDRLRSVKVSIQKTSQKLAKLGEAKEEAKKSGNWGNVIVGGVAGGLVSKSFESNGAKLLCFLVGAGLGHTYNVVTKKSREERQQQEVLRLESEEQQLQSDYQKHIQTFQNLQLAIQSTPKVLIPEPEPEPLEGTPVNEEQTFNEPLQTFTPSQQPAIGGKIISSIQLEKLRFQSLNFTGPWRNFIGQPSTNFHCAIHGKPGQGKSTFSLQFANYLANNFGRVLYISGEEGFSKTMKDKLEQHDAASKNLFVGDLHSLDEIYDEVQPNTFHFLFIDSLDDIGIDAEQLKELREHFAHSALVTISQSTKDGKMRGSQKIIHDCDIAIHMEKGAAVTDKNRFNATGKAYDVFT